MKPNYKPGKKATGSRIARDAVTKAKPVNTRKIAKELPLDNLAPKAGKGGERAQWGLNYEEGLEVDKKRMPNKESEQISEEGTRRFPRGKR